MSRASKSSLLCRRLYIHADRGQLTAGENRLLPNLRYSLLPPSVLTLLCSPSAAVSVNLCIAWLTLSRAILIGGSSSSASGEHLGSIFFFFGGFALHKMTWQKPHWWRMKSVSISTMRHFFDEAPQRRQRSRRNSPGTLSQSFFLASTPPPATRPPAPPLPSFVAVAVSQLVIKTIPGYCRGLMRIVWHTNTHSHIKWRTILTGAE